jgi:hypothetical protein
VPLHVLEKVLALDGKEKFPRNRPERREMELNTKKSENLPTRIGLPGH